MLRRVLIICADFSPSSYPQALRTRFFASRLSEFGWQPTVITVNPKYYEWPVDDENEKLLPESLEVIRTNALPTNLTRLIGIGDIGIRSLWHHWRAAKKLLRKSRFDVVFFSIPPNFTAVLGRLIYNKFNIPYVIDYNDPWVTPESREIQNIRVFSKRGISEWISRKLEPFALKRVGHIIGVSKGTVDGVIGRYIWLADMNATEIPHGGEESDFDYLRRNPRKNRIFNRNDGLRHIVYVGAVNRGILLTLKAIFGAIQLGCKRSPDLFKRFRIHFIGTTYAANGNDVFQVLPLARKVEIESLVTEHPRRVSYLDALQLIVDSHALLVPGSDVPHYTASKIFPYILSRRPILAVFHEASSVVNIINKTKAGRVVTFNNEFSLNRRIDEISMGLEELLLLRPNHEPSTCWEAFREYSTREMTKRLGKVFDKVVG